MENKILNLFAYDSHLTFSQIKEKLKIRTNLLAYWLNKLVVKGTILKETNKYSLAESSEHLVPHLSENKSTLPVVLVMIGQKNKYFLCERKKIPYKDKLSLPGGRLLIGESVKDAAKRIMNVKFGIKIDKINIMSINLEHVRKRSKFLYSFLLIGVSAQTKDEIPLTNIIKMKNKIVKSDYKMMRAKKEKLTIKTILSKYE